MDLIGIEPMTSSMPWKRAPSCATGPLFGGASLFSRMRAGKSNHCRGTKGCGTVSNVVGWAQNCRLRLAGLTNWLEGASGLAGKLDR